MTVKELIEELKTYDDDYEIKICPPYKDGYVFQGVDIDSVCGDKGTVCIFPEGS